MRTSNLSLPAPFEFSQGMLRLKRGWLGFVVLSLIIFPVILFAAIQTSCPGNVCSNTVNVGGQDVTYSWTQNHDLSSSTLKVRFASGPYAADGNPARFKVSVSKPFAGYAVLKNPDPTTALPPSQTVDVSSLWIERSATAVADGTNYDFTFELRYAEADPGQVDIAVEIAQYGVATSVDQTTVPTQRVEFDGASMTNRDEGQAFPAPPYSSTYLQCGDGIDNDLDYRLDCSDADCAGELIQIGTPNRYCEAVETTCNDGLDNDGDGLIDCADPQCNGRPGNLAGDKFCGFENGGVNHANCADGFDNDGNGKTDCSDDAPGTGCWRTGFQDCAVAENTDAMCTDNIDNDRDQNYSEDIDTNAATGIDCRDYDCRCTDMSCAMVRHCPISERMRWDAGSGTFVDTPAQCSDGLDNDLDGKIDCADDDCLGAPNCAQYEAWLPPAPLGTGEAGNDPAFYFNLCNDGFDNDGDGLVDADDPDCRNRFGACTPFGVVGLAAQEPVNFLSCGDGLDNDLNGVIDCGEASCRAAGMIGRAGCTNATCGSPAAYDYASTDAAACSVSEAGAALCGDGIDNDGNGAIDCADLACVGQNRGAAMGSSPAGPVCGTENSVALCSDGHDNDGNGDVDCFDAACSGVGSCALRPPAGWTPVACVTVPHATTLVPIVPGGDTLYQHDDRIYVNTPHRIRFVGAGSYTSLTIVIGDAVNPANAYPFDASAANCILSGTGASQMQYVSSSPDAGTIYGKAGETIADFDVTLTCANTSAIPLGPASFTVAIVSHHGSVIEYGEAIATVQVYEDVPPVMQTPGIEAEGAVGGTVNIPVGGTVRFQALPSDDPSGICRCDFDLDGTGAQSADGSCVVESAPFVNDATGFSVSASALDGPMNRSATSTPQAIDINVVPSVNRNLHMSTGRTTYAGGMPMGLDASFETDSASTFAGSCGVYVCTSAYACVLQTGATVSMVPTGAGTNLLTCLGTYTPPLALAAGRYYVFVETADSGGDVVRSNILPFLKCEAADAGTGECADADLDADGVPEGRFTPGSYAVSPAVAPSAPDYPPTGSALACDNCVNWANSSQVDRDANGIGDACEIGTVGRCRYKQCAVTGASCTDDADCDPDDADDRCTVVHQPMCARNCTVATEATDCAYDPDADGPEPVLTGFCEVDWGVCKAPGADEGLCCFDNPDCSSNECAPLVEPFIETSGGQFYSGGEISAGEEPPIHNAAFCLAAGGGITNFTSAAGCRLPQSVVYQLPRASNNYAGSFGVIDVNGILNGKYGPLMTGVNLNASGLMYLNGKIYSYPDGLTVTAPIEFRNGIGASRGNGLVVVVGDLMIGGDLTYENMNAADLRRLASVGWVVLKDPDTCPVSGVGPGCGNVVVDGNVTNIVGAFFAEGTISTGSSNVQLRADGMFVAKDIQFERQFSSRTSGSEVVNFDARAFLNPPPGLSDLSRALPGFQSVAGE